MLSITTISLCRYCAGLEMVYLSTLSVRFEHKIITHFEIHSVLLTPMYQASCLLHNIFLLIFSAKSEDVAQQS